MKLWKWFQSLNVVAICGAIASAAYLVFNALRASQLEQRATNNQRIAENIVQDHTKKHHVKAAKLQRSASRLKSIAAARRNTAELQMEKLGEKDSTIADIADQFNKRKLRQSITDAT